VTPPDDVPRVSGVGLLDDRPLSTRGGLCRGGSTCRGPGQLTLAKRALRPRDDEAFWLAGQAETAAPDSGRFSADHWLCGPPADPAADCAVKSSASCALGRRPPRGAHYQPRRASWHPVRVTLTQRLDRRPGSRPRSPRRPGGCHRTSSRTPPRRPSHPPHLRRRPVPGAAQLT
jgi:hypothetical protein